MLIRTDDLPDFILSGYKVEAYVPIFDGKIDCIMVRNFSQNNVLKPKKAIRLFPIYLKLLKLDNYEKLQILEWNH